MTARGTTAAPAYSRAVHVPGTPTAHRSAVAAADLMAVPGVVTCTKLTGVGSATAGTYNTFVVARNAYGATTAVAGNTAVTTETTNLGVRAAFAAVTGAVEYDIYHSTDGVAAKFVGRITEAQRASGIILSGVNTTSAGGTAGGVNIYVAGTGLAVNAGHLAQNTAWTPESLTAVDVDGAPYLDLDVLFSTTGVLAAGSLILLPFFADLSGSYVADAPVTMTFGGATGVYQPLRQLVRVNCHGRDTVIVVAAIAGTGAAVTINAVPN